MAQSYAMITGGSFPLCKAAGALNTHLYPVLRSRMVELRLPSPIYLHGVLLKYLSTRINLRFFPL
jgi:hypothetical protein